MVGSFYEAFGRAQSSALSETEQMMLAFKRMPVGGEKPRRNSKNF